MHDPILMILAHQLFNIPSDANSCKVEERLKHKNYTLTLKFLGVGRFYKHIAWWEGLKYIKWSCYPRMVNSMKWFLAAQHLWDLGKLYKEITHARICITIENTLSRKFRILNKNEMLHVPSPLMERREKQEYIYIK